MAQGINATIGYSNPTKVDIQNRMQYYSGENICGNQDKICSEGDYACLVERRSQTARRSNDAQLRTHDLPESKQHRKAKTTINTWQLCNAYKNDDMTF